MQDQQQKQFSPGDQIYTTGRVSVDGISEKWEPRPGVIIDRYFGNVYTLQHDDETKTLVYKECDLELINPLPVDHKNHLKHLSKIIDLIQRTSGMEDAESCIKIIPTYPLLTEIIIKYRDEEIFHKCSPEASSQLYAEFHQWLYLHDFCDNCDRIILCDDDTNYSPDGYTFCQNCHRCC